MGIVSKFRKLFGASSMPATPIPVYHNIDKQKDNPLIADNIHSVTSEVFHSQLSQLKEDYTIVFVDELIERIKKGQSVDKLCAITLDDGYKSVVEVAYPILEDLQIPATLFVTSEMVQNQTFWRDKVRYIVNNNLESDVLAFFKQIDCVVPEITSDNFYRATKTPQLISSKVVSDAIDAYFRVNEVHLDEFTSELYISSEEIKKKRKYLNFGNHSFNHYALSSLSHEEQQSEIEMGHQFLSNLGIPLSSVFSIPFGGLVTFNQHTVDILDELGYSGYLMCSSSAKASVFDMSPEHVNSPLVALTRFLPGNTASLF